MQPGKRERSVKMNIMLPAREMSLNETNEVKVWEKYGKKKCVRFPISNLNDNNNQLDSIQFGRRPFAFLSSL